MLKNSKEKMLKISAAQFLKAMFSPIYAKNTLLLKGMALLLTGLVGSHVQAATQHVVAAGDSLSAIAKRYNVSQTALTDANNLQVTTIQIGQILNIPNKNKPYNLYKVEAGDSLSSLSKKYNIGINDLAVMNKISPQAGLLIDSILTIPINGQAAEKKPMTKTDTQIKPPTTVTSNDKNTTRYRVEYGDSLSKIAKTYNVNINSLAQANNMTLSDNLYFGRYLVIPTTNNKQVTHKQIPTAAPISNKYVVRSGDTLMKVGNKFNLSFMDIAKLNNIDPCNLLTVGQVLILPANAVASKTKDGN